MDHRPFVSSDMDGSCSVCGEKSICYLHLGELDGNPKICSICVAKTFGLKAPRFNNTILSWKNSPKKKKGESLWRKIFGGFFGG